MLSDDKLDPSSITKDKVINKLKKNNRLMNNKCDQLLRENARLKHELDTLKKKLSGDTHQIKVFTPKAANCNL